MSGNCRKNKLRKRNLAKKEKVRKSKAYSNFIWNKRFNKAIAEAQLNFVKKKLFPKNPTEDLKLFRRIF